MNPAHLVTNYLSTHHLGNFYCGAIAIEATGRGLTHLVLGIIKVAQGYFDQMNPSPEGEETRPTFKGKASSAAKSLWNKVSKNVVPEDSGEDHFARAKVEFLGAGQDLMNAGIFTIGAFNPLAGVLIPVITIAASIINDNSRANDTVSKRYTTGAYLNLLPELIFNGASQQLSVNTGFSKQTSVVATGALMSYAACYALGIPH